MAVYTAIALKSGTNANVFLTIFGNRTDGVVVKSDQFELDSEKNNFKRSEVDYFRIETIKLGKPYQITISHDNTGIDPAWRLDRVSFGCGDPSILEYFDNSFCCRPRSGLSN